MAARDPKSAKLGQSCFETVNLENEILSDCIFVTQIMSTLVFTSVWRQSFGLWRPIRTIPV